MAGRLHGTVFWWSSWVAVVHPAGSWCPLFTVEPLVPGGFSQHQDQCCPTRGAKMGEGLQLQVPKSTPVPGHDHRRKTINYNHHRVEAFTSPRSWSSHLGSSLPSLPLLPGFPFRLKESKTSQTWSTTSIWILFYQQQESTQLWREKAKSVEYFPKQKSGAQRCTTEIWAISVRGMQVGTEKEERKKEERWRCEEKRDKQCSAVPYSA